MLARLFNLGGKIDPSASPEQQFFSTIRRPMMALGILAFIVFVLFSERRAIWPGDAEHNLWANVSSAIEDGTVELASWPDLPPLYRIISQGLALTDRSINPNPSPMLPSWVIRAPAIASACLTIFLIFWIGLMTGNQRSAFIAAAIACLTFGFFRNARWSHHEILLTCLVCASIGSWIRAHDVDKHAGIFAQLFYAFAALAALAGGAIGMIIPFLTALLFPMKPVRPLQKDHLLGLGLFLFIILGYMLLAHNELTNAGMGDVLAGQFLWKSQIPRLTEHSVPQFITQAVLDFLPWSLLLPLTMFHFRSMPKAPTDPTRLFSIWFQIAVFAALLTIGSRGNHLILGWPAAALLLGTFFDRQMTGPIVHEKPFWTSAMLASTLLVIAGTLLLLPELPLLRWAISVADLRLPAEVLATDRLRIFSFPLIAGGIVAAISSLRQRPSGFLWNLAFGLLLTAILAAVFVLPPEHPFR